MQSSSQQSAQSLRLSIFYVSDIDEELFQKFLYEYLSFILENNDADQYNGKHNNKDYSLCWWKLSRKVFEWRPE